MLHGAVAELSQERVAAANICFSGGVEADGHEACELEVRRGGDGLGNRGKISGRAAVFGVFT